MDAAVLTTDRLAKSYRGRRVVDEVSLGVSAGEIVGLLGPNGAGKTTTFYMVVGLIQPDDGTVYLDGQPLTRLAMHERAHAGIGYLAQEPSIFRKLSVEDNLRAIAETLPLSRAKQRDRVRVLLDEFDLTGLRDVRGYALSGGERRRVELARLLVTSPRFILLDEPFTGIDPIMVQEIQTFIFRLKQQGIGIFVTDHRVRETLEITDRAYIMHAGRILQSGSPQELVESREVKEIYLGERFSLSTDRHETG